MAGGGTDCDIKHEIKERLTADNKAWKVEMENVFQYSHNKRFQIVKFRLKYLHKEFFFCVDL